MAAHPLEQCADDKTLPRPQCGDVETKVEHRMGPPSGEAGADATSVFVSELDAGCVDVGCCIHRCHLKQRLPPRQLGESDDLTARIRQNRIGDFRMALRKS